MKIHFHDKRISGILCVLPETEALFDDEAGNYSFPVSQTMRLKKVMGYEKHRIAKPETSASDLCIFGIKKLISEGKIDRDEIAGIIVVTITPDYFVPHVGNIIQNRCGFSGEVYCIDILQGCCGYLIGLVQAFMLLDYNPGKKVLLVNTDTLSKKVSKQDRNSYPLAGDCAAITVIENSSDENDIHFNIKMDGSRGEALIIPAGGSRLACSAGTAEMMDDGNGNVRSLDNFHMDGSAVFQFVMTDVPPIIAETLNNANASKDAIDWYIFHQPNRFMLQKLVQKLDVPPEKVFMNIVERFGNTSGSSIPLTAVHNLGDRLVKEKYKCCLSAFGGGLSYGAMVIELGGMEFCEACISNL